MIKVNLLRERPPNPTLVLPRPDKTVTYWIVTFLLTSLGLMAWHQRIATRVAQQQAQIQELQRESLQLQSVRLEIQRYRRRKAELDRRLAVIQELRDERKAPVRLLNSIVSSIPDNPPLWLTNLSQRGKELSLEGETLDVNSIADFVRALEKTPAVETIELDYWEQRPGGLKFKLSGRQAR